MAFSVTAAPYTVIGALTRVYTAPSACPSTYYQEFAGRDGESVITTLFGLASECSGSTMYPASSCNPLSTNFQNGIWSPGLDCPSGFEVACATSSFTDPKVNLSSNTLAFEFDYALTAGETAVGCCPKGYTCYRSGPGYGQTCRLHATSTTFGASVCGSTTDIYGSQLEPSVESFAASIRTFSMATAEFWAPFYQLHWREQDLKGRKALVDIAQLTSVSSSQSTTSSSPTDLSSTLSVRLVTVAPSAQASVQDKNGSAPSSSAKIAIGVTIPLITIIVLIALGIFIRRRRLHRSRSSISSNPEKAEKAEATLASSFDKPELSGTPSRWEMGAQEHRRAELGTAQERWELGARERPKEVSGEAIVAELDTGDQVAKEKSS